MANTIPSTQQTLVNADRYPGPAFTFGPTPLLTYGVKDSVHVIWTSIVNILKTPKKTIRYNPSLGSIVPYLVFDPNDPITQGLIRHYTFKDLSDQEPRIRVRAVNTTQPDEHTVHVSVSFSIVGDPSARVYNGPVSFNLLAAA